MSEEETKTPLRAEDVTAKLTTRWLGRTLFVEDTVGSTNDDVMARAVEGAAGNGTVVIADTQTAGRGRMGRGWHSPPGENLYMSLLLRLGLPPASAPPITLAAGVAIAEAVGELGLPGTIKWPNDICIERKKVAGILTETSTRENRLDAIVIGVGINVNSSSFPPELTDATSLRIENKGQPFDRAAVAALLLGHLERWIDRFVHSGVAPIAHAWKRRSHIFGMLVKVVVDGRTTITGRARDMDEDGGLWLEDEQKKMWRVVSGEVMEIR